MTNAKSPENDCKWPDRLVGEGEFEQLCAFLERNGGPRLVIASRIGGGGRSAEGVDGGASGSAGGEKGARRTVPEMLEECADTYRERGKAYGNSYQEFGAVLNAMYPNGVTIEGADDWNRWGVFIQIMSKIMRYRKLRGSPRADDTLKDLAVYATMLRELETGS